MKIRAIVASVLRSGLDEIRICDAPREELRQRLTRRTRMLIEPRKGTNYRFTRYGKDGNSPHQLGSEIYLRTGRTEAVASFLNDFLHRQRPANLAELLFGKDSLDLAPLDTMSPLVKFQPWMDNYCETAGFVGQREASFKQISWQHIDNEAKKQVRAVVSLRDRGYQPEVHRRGYLRGRLLLANGDYRFLVEDGKHRLGALNALGHGEIAVRLIDNGPSVIDLEEVDRWPLVASGLCPRDLAVKLMLRHFD